MPWPKGVPRKGHVKGSLRKPAAAPFALPDDQPVTMRFSDLVHVVEVLTSKVEALTAKVAELAKRREHNPAASPRAESVIERLCRIDTEVRAWTDAAHWASSRADHRAARAYAKACASSLRLQAIELIQAHMERLEEYRKKNPIAATAEKVS